MKKLDKKVEKKATPFFERFLTESMEDMKDAKGGYRDYTMKYPSDSDEMP